MYCDATLLECINLFTMSEPRSFFHNIGLWISRNYRQVKSFQRLHHNYRIGRVTMASSKSKRNGQQIWVLTQFFTIICCSISTEELINDGICVLRWFVVVTNRFHFHSHPNSFIEEVVAMKFGKSSNDLQHCWCINVKITYIELGYPWPPYPVWLMSRGKSSLAFMSSWT